MALWYFGTVLVIFYTFLPRFASGATITAGNEPPSERAQALSQPLATFDWRWFLMFTISAGLVFGIILFVFLYFRRWQGLARLGWFFVTIVALANRALQPTVLFWNAFGVFAGVISLFMGFYLFHKREYVVGKEPVFYFLNCFSLLVISFSSSYYFDAVSALSLIASLFFITTKNPRKPGRHGQAEPFVLEILRRKTER